MCLCFEFGLCKSIWTGVEKSEPLSYIPLNGDIIDLTFNPVPKIRLVYMQN